MDPVKFRKRKCEGCESGRAVSICDECRTFMCKACLSKHKSGTETKHHSLFNLNVPRELSMIYSPEEVAKLFSSVDLSSDTDSAVDQSRPESAFLSSDFLEETSQTETHIEESDLSSSDFVEESSKAVSRSSNTPAASSCGRDSPVVGSDFSEKVDHPEYALMSDSENWTSTHAKESKAEYKAGECNFSNIPSASNAQIKHRTNISPSEAINELSDDVELEGNNELPWLTKSSSGEVVRSKSLDVKDVTKRAPLTRHASTPVPLPEHRVASTLPARLSEKVVVDAIGDIQDLPKLEVIGTQELTLKISQEKKGNDIRGALVLPCGSLVIIDNGRKELKLYDRDGKCIFSLDDPPCTLGMTYVRNDIIATCGIYQKLLLWSVRNNRITRQRKELVLSDSFSGIHFDETLFCIQQNQGKYLQILDTEGHIHHKILVQNPNKKPCKFGNSVRLDSSNQLVYYTSIEKPRCVRCVNFAADTLWECQISGIPSGLTDAPRCLLVTDANNNCVHVLSKSGSCLYKLVDKSLISSAPEGIHCDKESGKVVVHCGISKDKRYRVLVLFLKY